MQGVNATLFGNLQEFGAQTGLGWYGWYSPIFQEGTEILPAPPHQNRHHATQLHFSQSCTNQAQVFRQAQDFIWFHHIQEVVFGTQLLLWGGFRRADIHTLVNLTTVRIDDLRSQAVFCQLLDQLDRQLRLAYRRWAQNHSYGLQVLTSQESAPSVASGGFRFVARRPR